MDAEQEQGQAVPGQEGPKVEIRPAIGSEKKRKRRKGGIPLPPFCVNEGRPGEPFDLVKYLGMTNVTMLLQQFMAVSP